MPTTSNRRQPSSKDRKADARTEAIRAAYAYLANVAAPCTTGGTLISLMAPCRSSLPRMHANFTARQSREGAK